MSDRVRILFVDDEPNVLAALRRIIRLKRPEWEAICAENGEAALLIMAENPAHVVISDVMMPGMDGGMLLKKIKNQWPATLRIALSGQVSMEQVLESIRTVHQYIGKPSEGDTLINRIELAMSCKDILLDEHMQQLVAEIDELPVIPYIYQAIEKELSGNEPSMDRIAELIMRDTALAAKLLSLVNSPFFGLSNHVRSIRHAITLLGQDIIRALVLSSKIFMTHENIGLPGSSLQRLGDHSYRVSAIIKHLFRLCGKTREETIQGSVAAMLHDVGKLVLAKAFPDKFRKVISLVENEHIYIYDAEREFFGTTHAELGAYLLALWGMDANVVHAVGRHHQHDAFDCSQTMLLHVANVMDHNCIRLSDEHAFRIIHSKIRETEEHHEMLKEWCLKVQEKWGDLESHAAFHSEGFINLLEWKTP